MSKDNLIVPILELSSIEGESEAWVYEHPNSNITRPAVLLQRMTFCSEQKTEVVWI